MIMELKEILNLVHDSNLHIGLCYVGEQSYALTTKKEILKNTTLLNSKVSNINAFKNEKGIRILGVRIFKN